MPPKDSLPDMEHLDISDTDLEDPFASPSKPPAKPNAPKSSASKQSDHSTERQPTNDTDPTAQEAREAALRRELSGIRNINSVIEAVISSLDRAKGNMDVSLQSPPPYSLDTPPLTSPTQTVSATVSNASSLLNTWTRILSQTEHNSRLILNTDWNGASADIADMENEGLMKEQERERKEFEEARRREENEKARENVERRKSETCGDRGRKASRGRGRGLGRGGTLGNVGLVGQGTNRGIGGGRPTVGRTRSGVGRGRERAVS